MLFSHLHVHSCYSFVRGVDRPESIAEAAEKKGFTALALTETGGLYGAVAHQKACEARGLKPLFGVELPPAVLLVRNREGWKKLCRLITAHATGGSPDIAAELRGCEDLYVLSGDRGFLKKAKAMLPAGLLFAELVVHSGDKDARRLARWAESENIPCVATNDVCFVGRESHGIAKIMAAIRELKTVGTLTPEETPSPEAYLAGPAEMLRRFHWHKRAYANAQRIADDCDFRLELGVRLLPKYDRLETASALGDLSMRCLEALPGRYPGGHSRAVVERLNGELKVVAHHKLGDYFLLVHDIVLETERRGYRTFGRGSASGSLICYLLRITHVEPLENDLCFERFMNLERSDLPDIDLDFAWNQRDDVIDYVYERFGHDKVAMICTHSTFKVRASLREVARAMGIPDRAIGKVTRRIPHVSAAQFDKLRHVLPECRNLPFDEEPWKGILDIARRIDGFPRHISEHPCGLVIAPTRLDEIVPLEKGAKGHLLTQMDMYPIEDLGLVKMDLLGQRGLAVISDVVSVVNSRNGKDAKPLSIDDLVLDAPSRRLLSRGDSMGCFYIESPAMRGLLKKLRVPDFEMLTAASSLIRPGPSHSGMLKSFIRRHHGEEAVRYLHPKMEGILKSNYGIMIYQEDVMRVAYEVAGMSMGDADKMRRSMTRKRFHEPLERMFEGFMKGAANRNIKPETAREIWRQIASFAGYAFCKSHSAAFAQVSVQSLHLRTHYPAEFMAAVLSNGGGFFQAAAYVEEARRMGLRIVPPYVSKAKYHYQGREGYLMVGLQAVKNLKRKTADRIVAKQPFGDVFDFLERVRPAKDEAESLVFAGALDRFGYSRPQLMWLVSQKVKGEARGVLTGVSPEVMKVPQVPDYPAREALRLEIESLGFSATAHPLSLFREVAERERVTPAVLLEERVNRMVRLLVWLVHSMRTRTAQGKFMKFLSCEDTSAKVECVLFPPAYRRLGHLIRGGGPYLVTGIVRDDFGALSVDVQDLQNVDRQHDLTSAVSELGN